MKITPTQLKIQYNAAQVNGLAKLLTDAASKHNLPPAYVLAVASRETNIRNITGDGGHGHGVIQIDDRYHAAAIRAAGNWQKSPGKLIDYGVSLLAANYAWAKKNWPKYTNDQHLKIAASAYNVGQGGARAGIVTGDSDARTTGRDYGRDVMERYRALLEVI